KRELFSFFVTPLAWVVMTAFLVIQGLHFYLVLANFAAQGVSVSADAGPVQTFFGQTVFLYIPLFFVCPVLTMRLFAEERRSGTIEPLLTAPVTSTGVVLGKYAAVLTAYVVMWAPTAAYMWIVSGAGDLDWHVVGTGYLAVFVVGAGYLALGTMTSAVTKSQLAAAITSAMVIMALFNLGVGEVVLPEGTGRDLCSYLSVWSQMNDFSRGIVDSRRLAFDLTLVALPLFVTVRALDSWRDE
ncbi:MAG: ABC transporter permease subunit, partial [Myxococcales bacterium]|nr:ABC transporter permease subunit [Myxococcales bacterium]